MKIFYAFISIIVFLGCTSTQSNYSQLKFDTMSGSFELYSSTGLRIGAMKIMKNNKFCRPINNGKSIEYAPIIIPPKTSAPTKWEYNDIGFYENNIQPPNVPDGKVVSSITYRYDQPTNSVVADYTFEDAPKPVRTFSKLKLYGALSQAGLWDTFEAWLKTQTINGVNAYTAFSLAQDLNDSNELFNNVVQQAKTALGVSDEVVEMILQASLLEM